MDKLNLLHSPLGRVHADGIIFDIWWVIKALNKSLGIMYCWSNRGKERQSLKSEPLSKQKDSDLLQSLRTCFMSAFTLAKLNDRVPGP